MIFQSALCCGERYLGNASFLLYPISLLTGSTPTSCQGHWASCLCRVLSTPLISSLRSFPKEQHLVRCSKFTWWWIFFFFLSKVLGGLWDRCAGIKGWSRRQEVFLNAACWEFSSRGDGEAAWGKVWSHPDASWLLEFSRPGLKSPEDFQQHPHRRSQSDLGKRKQMC